MWTWEHVFNCSSWRDNITTNQTLVLALPTSWAHKGYAGALRREEAILENSDCVSVLALLVVGALFAVCPASCRIGAGRALLNGNHVLVRALKALRTFVARAVPLAREVTRSTSRNNYQSSTRKASGTGAASGIAQHRVEATRARDDALGFFRVAGLSSCALRARGNREI